MTPALKALAIVVAYVAAIAGVIGALLVGTGDEQWIGFFIAIAIVHLGTGILVARWWAPLLPFVLPLVAWVAGDGGDRIFDVGFTTVAVSLPSAILVAAGVAVRIGWDDGGRERRGGDVAAAEQAG